jgi:hypothetical protein
MRAPHRRRPLRREIDTSHSADLEDVAGRVKYIGSAEHKTYPSPAGPPSLRADATKCDPALHGDFEVLAGWLREAIRRGCVGAPWEGGFPRYAWARQDGVWYEGRLVNSGLGQYKGYALDNGEVPSGTERYQS